eukprot:scaffold3558_cov60-Phaeocystis_antarctica.AAC.4
MQKGLEPTCHKPRCGAWCRGSASHKNENERTTPPPARPHQSAPSLVSSLMTTSSTELAFMSKAGSAILRAISFCSSVRVSRTSTATRAGAASVMCPSMTMVCFSCCTLSSPPKSSSAMGETRQTSRR